MKVYLDTRKLAGFSLIELMIAVAIVGILTAVALPSYQNYVQQSKRAVAKAVLYENAQFMEQFYTENNAYDQNLAGTAVSTLLPNSQSPKTGTIQYNVTVVTLTAATFTLRAAPVGTMAGDACGTLTLSNTGVQGSAGTVADCWNR